MFSSDEDDENTFDQLRSIKAFTIEQLYLLHPDVGCPAKQDGQQNHQQGVSDSNRIYFDREVYQDLVDYERIRSRLSELRNEVEKLHKSTFDHVDKAWILKEASIRKIAMCQQGKIAEATFEFKQAHLDSKQLESFSFTFNRLLELINKDFVYYSFENQIKLNRIITQLARPYQMEELELRRDKLKSSISTLIDFIRFLGDSRTEFVLQCRRWFRALVRRLLEEPTTDNFRFVIAQITRGPAGTADWCADLIECKSFNQTDGFEAAPQYITHCSILLNELFNKLRYRLRRINTTSNDTPNTTTQPDVEQNWSYVDPRFNCAEELQISQTDNNQLSESDVIKLCLKIPIAQIFSEFVRQCLGPDDLRFGSDKNYEFIMLKLLTIGTIIIKTCQSGLEIFDSIQYCNLVEYLSHQIRRVVTILSNQWFDFRSRLKGIDDALMMRLQVEYDNFILRSILVILELRESGIWRHLCHPETEFSYCEESAITGWTTNSLRPAITKLLQVTGLAPTEASSNTDLRNQHEKMPCPKTTNSLTFGFAVEWFKEVSEPMLWHILWQFYHNAFTSSCDYHSDIFWLNKFREKSSVYLFIKKMTDSPEGECGYLLNSLTSMILSRSRQDSKFVSFVAEEMFNLSFKQEALRSKITKRATRSLALCAEKFPNLISTYIALMSEDDASDDVVELIKGCSLNGWLCDHNEVEMLSTWLVECQLKTSKSKVARMIITKILLNSPSDEFEPIQVSSDQQTPKRQTSSSRLITSRVINVELRRKLALVLYESSVRLLPDDITFTPRSLGASVEVAYEALYRRETDANDDLIELACGTTYQHLYIWLWRLLTTLRLHILNQKETNWNDIQSRSGASRSIKNTVLINDMFHPVPSIADPECVSLNEGVKNQNPMASFIYMILTDATWRADTLDQCLDLINIMVNTGHLTPSLLAMKYLTTCHLNDLLVTIAKDKRAHEYFTAILSGSFDPTRLASLIMSQLEQLKQYRQLQLSQFYITVLFEAAALIAKQTSSSWFSSDEYSLEKVACLLDYIAKFNFSTQRREIIQKFYDCSYSIQGGAQAGGWFGYFVSSNSLNVNSTKREFLTTLHVLTQKFKKNTWLRWITTECDTMRLEKIWENIIVYLNSCEEATLDAAIKKVCPHYNATIIKSMIPINSWMKLIFDLMETDLNHPLCPIIWYNFFLNYFANSLNGVSVGYKLISQGTITKLMSRLDALFNYHLFKQRNWSSTSRGVHQTSLAKLYRAYKLWLHDPSLRDAYVDLSRLSDDYIVPLLKSVLESSTEGEFMQYIDVQGLQEQNQKLVQIWSSVIEFGYKGSESVAEANASVEELAEITEVSAPETTNDAASFVGALFKASNLGDNSTRDTEDELRFPGASELSPGQMSRTFDELMGTIKHNFNIVIEESSVYGFNLMEIDKIKGEIIKLVQQLYMNKKRELVRVAPCIEGNLCSGPARIKLEVEKAFLDERKSQCIQDRRRQCLETVSDLLLLPSNRAVQAVIIIESYVRHLVADRNSTGLIVESLLKWVNEPTRYSQLNGTYHVANHLLKLILELLSITEQADVYNRTVIEVCTTHPSSVQIMSPHLCPSDCSPECFLNLYQGISGSLGALGPMATFVLMSKFDVNNWLEKNRQKDSTHTLIKATCAALGLLGKYPDESFTMTFDLYKRHLQIELAPPNRRKPDEIVLVANEFLKLMDKQLLNPDLWIDFLVILGLDKDLSQICSKSNNRVATSVPNHSKSANSHSSARSDISSSSISTQLQLGNFDGGETLLVTRLEEISRLADCQVIFDYQSLNCFVQQVCEFFNEKHQSSSRTLLELYADFTSQFSLVMVAILYMWIKTFGDYYPDNHTMIWKQFINFWNHWVFISKNCQSVSKESYSLVANLFVASIRFMAVKMPDNFQSILQSSLASFTNYVCETKEVVYLELTLLQRSLKNLPWSSFLLTPQDYLRLSALSQQDNYNVSDLVSHILMQCNIKDSLKTIHSNNPNLLPQVSEDLAIVIVLQSSHLRGFRLHGRYFATIPAEHIPAIVDMILPRMEFANLEHSQNNKLLVNLLRFMCIRLDSSSSEQPSASPPLQNITATETIHRSLIYSQFVSNYLIELIKNHPNVVSYNKNYLVAVMENSLQDLKALKSPDTPLHQKTTLYEALLECCSSELLDQNSRLLLADAAANSQLLKNRPIGVLELLHAIGRVVRDPVALSHMVEQLIGSYLNMNGHYEKVWKSFCLRILPSDIYLDAAVKCMNPLSLLVYFESVIRNETDSSDETLGSQNMQETHQETVSQRYSLMSTPIRIWSGFFHWLTLMTSNCFTDSNHNDEVPSVYLKLTTVWLRATALFESHIQDFIRAQTKFTYTTEKQNISDNSQEEDRMSKAGEESSNHRMQRGGEDSLMPCHKFLIDFIKQLVAVYESYFSGGLWAYLRSSARNEQSARIKLVALTVASFLANRSITCLKAATAEDNSSNITSYKALMDELLKLREICLSKLDTARKSKYFISSAQFLETLLEGVQRDDKVQYCEGVQLIKNYVKTSFPIQNPANETVLPGLAGSNNHEDDPRREARVCLSQILASYCEH